MLTLDHIALACTDLAASADLLSQMIGAPLQTGGQHPRYGTHNVLLGMGDIYLELIAGSAAPMIWGLSGQKCPSIRARQCL